MKGVGLKKAEAEKQNWQMKGDSLKLDKREARAKKKKVTNNQMKKLTKTFRQNLGADVFAVHLGMCVVYVQINRLHYGYINKQGNNEAC